jgi:hypothetical protein
LGEKLPPYLRLPEKAIAYSVVGKLYLRIYTLYHLPYTLLFFALANLYVLTTSVSHISQ